MQLFLVSVPTLFIITFLIFRYECLHHTFSAGDGLAGVQKIYVCPVPRVGGVGFMAGEACLLGFLIAEISVLAACNVMVSAWFPLLLAIIVCETLLSIYRRAMRRHSPIAPDGLHLHMLIFRRIVRFRTPWFLRNPRRD